MQKTTKNAIRQSTLFLTALLCLAKHIVALEAEDETEGVAIGIDLGTTYSGAAYFDPEQSKVIFLTDENDKETIPSMLWYNKKTGKMLIGHQAKGVLEDSANKIWDAKRIIGRQFNEKIVQNDMKSWPFKVTANKDGIPVFKPTLTSEELKLFKQKINKQGVLRPEEISALLLKKIKADAEKKLGKKVSKAVITVPAYFNNQQRQATKDAGQIANMEVLRVINEPTSAAIAFGLGENKQDGEKTLIFDLGGGTFDVSIVEIEEGFFDVKSSDGDPHLGGQDFDKYLINMFLKKSKIKKESLSANELNLLKLKAEKIKIKLSKDTEAEFKININKKEVSVKITRAEFENELDKRVKKKLLKTVDKAIEGAKIKKSDIKHLVMVGGSTRIPKVRQIVQKYLNRTPYTKIDPDKAVAYGAAVQAAILSGVKTDEMGDVIVVDVTPLALGIETKGGLMTVLVPMNTKIPTVKKQTFTPASAGQDSVVIAIYQGPHKMAKKNNKMGEFVLTEIAKDFPPIEIEFNVDANGIVKVTAHETRNGKKGDITLDKVSTISDEEKERIMREFKENEEADNLEADIVSTKQNIIGQAQKLATDQAPEDLKNKVKEILDEVNMITEYTEENLTKIKEIEAKFTSILQMAGAQAGPAGAGEAEAEEEEEEEDEDEL